LLFIEKVNILLIYLPLSDRFGDLNSRHSLNDFLTEAKDVLAARPELAKLVGLIGKKKKFQYRITAG